MNISIKNLIIGTTVVFFGGATVSYYITRANTPVKIETKTQVVEKVVIKEVESKKIATKTKVDKVTTTTKNKDGTETVVEVDKSTSDTQEESKKVSSETTDKKTVSSTTSSSEKDWRVGVKTDISTTTYEFSAGRRVLWGIWAEASYNTEVKRPLVGLSLEF